MAFFLLEGGCNFSLLMQMTPNSLRLTLVTIVVTLQLTSLGVVSVMSGNQLEQQQQLETSAALKMHADEVVEKTRLFLVPALSQLTVASQLIADGVLDPHNDQLLATFFRSQLRSNHWLKGMYLGRENGSLIRVARFESSAKSGSQFNRNVMITKSILVQGENRQVIYEQRDEETGDIRQWDNSEERSDPRQQEWYSAAHSGKNLVWSNAFSFYANGKPTVSASVAVTTRDGLEAGVLSVAVDLHDLTAFIDNTRSGSNLSAVMLDANGRIIAHSAGQNQPGPIGFSDIDSLFRDSSNTALFELYSRTHEQRLGKKDGEDTFVEHVNLAKEKQLGMARSVNLFNGAINWSLLITQPDYHSLSSSGNILDSGMRLAMLIIATPGILALLFVVIVTGPVYRLHRQATVDQLTRAFNRDEFETRVRTKLAQAHNLPADQRQIVVALDLDGFKIINDSFGHSAGDVILKTVVKRLQANLQPKDIVGRVGGDEFAFTCVLDKNIDATLYLEQLRLKIVSDPVPTTSGRHSFGMTMGFTEIRPEDDLYTLLKRADHALVSGKATRKNCTYSSGEHLPRAQKTPDFIIERKEVVSV
ncbi:diguanylate cyclase [Granulosicoccus antarcticus]|uniref:diguanylate cyclase n=1 Tax=Granulosicoccus antarcticus IMCC3135 TaxID=1192854 RepID=A0A2Z2NZZ5_9GAMM|nr:sensor domain-containing diguanylate cyclase [Granulosicoccus antarcticus]ASJ72704.1 Cyclic di-GMP phosphodiesterase PdeB [Granulosicoccus antarcticus IMCC3135]